MKKIIERINLCRGTYSVSEFAVKVGFPPQTVDNYLSERRKLSVQFLIAVCTNCSVSSDWLLGFSDVRRGTAAPPSTPELQSQLANKESEIARLKSEITRLNGENLGLRYALEALGKGK